MIKLTMRAAALLAATTGTFLQAQTPVFETLYQFTGPDGRNPQTAMTVGHDGALYGTTLEGGTFGGGVVFRYSEEDGYVPLKHLDPATFGQYPRARLISIGDGNLYGACKTGTGNFNDGGSIFKVDQMGVVSLVHALSGDGGTIYRPVYLTSGEPDVLHVACEDSSGILRVPLTEGSPTIASSTILLGLGTPKPQSIIRASDGSLYGTTITGGANQQGSFFRANADGSGYTKIYDAIYQNGSEPTGAMVQGKDGHLYGLFRRGGFASNNGVLYRFTLDGAFSIVHRFTDFDYPHCDLIQASDGMLYGVAENVGPGGNGSGGIWRVKPDGTGYKVLYHFQNNKNGESYPDGRGPIGGLVQAPDGHIYGTTYYGAGNGPASGGTIFRLKLNLPPPPVNRPPIAVDDFQLSTGSALTIPVKANDYDADGDALSVQIDAAPTAGNAIVQPDGSILYTPNSGNPTADTFTYKISDGRGGSTIGKVFVQTVLTVTDPVGSFNGILRLDDDLDGEDVLAKARFTLVVGANKKFTGKLYTQRKTIPFKGTLNAQNAAAVALTITKGTKSILFVSAQPGTPKTMRVYVLGTHIWTGTVGSTVLSGSDVKKSYTVQLKNAVGSVPAMPIGQGYATMKITPKGVVTAVGKLGDGKVLKWTSSLVELPAAGKVIPVFSEPLKDASIGGNLLSSGNPGEDFLGEVHWKRAPLPDAATSAKPYANGFEGDVNVVVGLYTPPAPRTLVMDLSGRVVEVQGPMIPGGGFGNFTVDGIRIIPEAPLRSLSFSRSTGLYSGAFTIGGKSVPFKGVVNQGSRTGTGQLSVAGVTGSAAIIVD